jgi:Tol biopolymer transport system component
VLDIDSNATFSPDGKQFAFVRYYPKEAQSALIVVNADGSEERKLAIRKAPYRFHMPSWSPFGDTIACSAGSDEAADRFMNVIEVRLEDGVEQPIGSQKWAGVGQVAWLSDGRGLIIIVTSRGSASSQIWQLSYPAGEARRITNDLNDYWGVDLTADSDSLVTIQSHSIQRTWIVPDGDAAQAKQITPQADTFSWTPDGRLVYESQSDLWIVDADGSKPKQLTVGAKSNHHPIVSRDGRYIIFKSNRTDSSHIWRMDIDGSNPKQLTSGNGEILGDCSPDSQWLVYVAGGALWKLSVNGGNPMKLADNVQHSPSISPDGKLIACDYWDKQPHTPSLWAVILFEGGAPIKTFDIPAHGVRWAPDGQALLYSVTRGGVSNIWRQPLAGGAPKQLTYFKSDQIFWFDWSRDGKQLACSRGVVTDDVVLMSNLK